MSVAVYTPIFWLTFTVIVQFSCATNSYYKPAVILWFRSPGENVGIFLSELIIEIIVHSFSN